MPEYFVSTCVESPRDTLFDLLMDPSNLPRFVSGIHAVEPVGDNGVLIRGPGFSLAASICIVDVLRRLEWSIGVDWSGWVEVDGDDDAGVAQLRAAVQCSTHPTTRSAAVLRVNDQIGDIGEFLSRSVVALKGLVEALPATSLLSRPHPAGVDRR